MHNIIIIKGSPGVGKTYLSKNLVSRLKKKKLAVIPLDTILHFDQRKLNENKLQLGIKNAGKIARSFLREDFNIIIEYTFDISADLRLLIEEIKSYKTSNAGRLKIFIFHLSASYEDVKERNRNRRDGSDPLPERILEKLYRKCEDMRGSIKEETIINTSNCSFSELLALIISKVK